MHYPDEEEEEEFGPKFCNNSNYYYNQMMEMKMRGKAPKFGLKNRALTLENPQPELIYSHESRRYKSLIEYNVDQILYDQGFHKGQNTQQRKMRNPMSKAKSICSDDYGGPGPSLSGETLHCAWGSKNTEMWNSLQGPKPFWFQK